MRGVRGRSKYSCNAESRFVKAAFVTHHLQGISYRQCLRFEIQALAAQSIANSLPTHCAGVINVM